MSWIGLVLALFAFAALFMPATWRATGNGPEGAKAEPGDHAVWDHWVW